MKYVKRRGLILGCWCLINISMLMAVGFDGTSSIVFESSSVELPGGTLAKGFVRFDDGFSVAAGSSVTLNIIPAVKGAINLNATGKVILDGDLFLASNVTLPQGGVLDGQGNVVFFQGNLTIPRGKRLKITGNTVIDGQGHELIFEDESGSTAGGALLIDGQAETSLTLRNIIVKGLKNYTSGRAIRFGSAENQQLILENAVMHLAGNYSVAGGALTICNDVMFTGAHTFYYRSSYDCTIEKYATLMLDMDVVFRYTPEDKEKNHVVMLDRTSKMYLNGCTINTPHNQGLVLTKGHIIVDHKTRVDGNNAVRDAHGVTLGDGTEANDILVDIMPGASLEVIEGILSYNNPDVVVGMD